MLSGSPERMNRTLMGKSKAKISEIDLPFKMWGEAVLYFAFELSIFQRKGSCTHRQIIWQERFI